MGPRTTIALRLPAIALLAVIVPTIVAAQEVLRNTRPTVVTAVEAQYTPQARAAKIEGTVIVDVVVLRDGTVGNEASVVQSLDTTYGLDEQAVKAAKQWKFKPATRDGEAVDSHVTIELTFKLDRKRVSHDRFVIGTRTC